MKKLVFLLLAISLLLVSCGNDNNTDSSLQGTNTEAPREEENSYPPASNFNMKDIHGRELSLTGIEPIWFEIENRLPYCVKKSC